MVQRLAIAFAAVAILAGCSSQEGNAEDMHLNAPTVKSKGNVDDQKARGMTEETTRGMGEKNIGDKR